MQEDGREVVLAIDFNNLVFASSYSQALTNSMGMNVNAIKGFFSKLKMLREIFNPNYIVLASDLSRSRTFRRAIYAGYKAQRKPSDPGVLEQMKYVNQLCALLGYQNLNNELYEADDILGMISRYCEDNNMDTVIVSSDRDLYQLITDHVFIMSPRGNELIDKEYIRDKYRLTPEQWIDLKILQGDPSDNIPGIYGIGPKTALELMNEYGSIDGIYEHLNEIKPKIRELLLIGEKSIPLTRQLVTILTDYKLMNITDVNLHRLEKHPNEIYQLLDELEVHSLYETFRFDLLN